MFPFTYTKRIIIPADKKQKIDIHEIQLKFIEQFDNPNMKDINTIIFDNFNFFLKRHKWLDSGILKISENDNQVIADIELEFYKAPVMIFILCILHVVYNRDNILFAFLGITAFVFFYFLLFIWTSTMYKFSIKRTIKHQLFISETELDDNQKIVVIKDNCPACGNKLTTNENECRECGLFLGDK